MTCETISISKVLLRLSSKPLTLGITYSWIGRLTKLNLSSQLICHMRARLLRHKSFHRTDFLHHKAINRSRRVLHRNRCTCGFLRSQKVKLTLCQESQFSQFSSPAAIASNSSCTRVEIDDVSPGQSWQSPGS